MTLEELQELADKDIKKVFLDCESFYEPIFELTN